MPHRNFSTLFHIGTTCGVYNNLVKEDDKGLLRSIFK